MVGDVNSTVVGLSGALCRRPGIIDLPPLGYLDFLSLTSQAKMMITDSGGRQEESTALGIPLSTGRSKTERPATVDQDASTLVGSSPEMLRHYRRQLLDGRYKQGRWPNEWNGRAADRIAPVLVAGQSAGARRAA